MASVAYNPAARFDVETTDVVYLEHPSVSLLATIYQPKGEGPSLVWWTFMAAGGS